MAATETPDPLSKVLRTVWGYDSFRPAQREAMESVLGNRDSLVVLPTGGGKSLCYQAPAVATDRLAVVVSPLISLMKDQVDALQAVGVPARCVNSTLNAEEQRRVAVEVQAGRIRLLYMAPERLVQERMLSFLDSMNVAFFAIDESRLAIAIEDAQTPSLGLGLPKLAEVEQGPIRLTTAEDDRCVRERPPERGPEAERPGPQDVAVARTFDVENEGAVDRCSSIYRPDARHDRLLRCNATIESSSGQRTHTRSRNRPGGRRPRGIPAG